MKVDCSKLANKGDLLSLLFTVILIGAVVLVVFLTQLIRSWRGSAQPAWYGIGSAGYLRRWIHC